MYPLVFEPPPNSEVIVTGSSRARELGLKLDPGQAAYNDKNDWQPSLGLAYSPLGNNRLVLRASYRILHSPMTPIQGLLNVGRNYPFFYLQKAESPTLPNLNLSKPFASGIIPALTFQAADPYLRNPYIQQREFSHSIRISARLESRIDIRRQKNNAALSKRSYQRSVTRQARRTDSAAAAESGIRRD